MPDPEKALKYYGLEQHQRKLERAIREQKRIIAGTIDKDNLKTEKNKLATLQLELREFLEANPQLRRAPRRENPRV